MVFSQDFTIYQRIYPLSVLYINKSTACSLLFADNAIVELAAEETNTLKKYYDKVRDVYGCLGIISSTYSEGVQFLVLLKSHTLVGKIYSSEVYRITGVEVVQIHKNQSPDIDTDRVNEVKKIFSCGAFYFSYSKDSNAYDLTLNLQQQAKQFKSDGQFYWNRGMHLPFHQFGVDCDNWLLPVICGSVEMRTIFCAGKQARVCVLSRVSCARYGTRFNVRGIDDNGDVANFAETEQIIFTDNGATSFLMLRGSVPTFWSQQGIQVGSHKIKLDRSVEASMEAFVRHFGQLNDRYGVITVLNLLGVKEGEGVLSGNYKYMISNMHANVTPNYVAFDYHAIGKSADKASLLKQKVKKFLDQMKFYYVVDGATRSNQCGAIRVNCMDCLDRTNAAQAMLASEVLQLQVACLIGSDPLTMSKFVQTIEPLWKENGNKISKMYAGTQMLDRKSKMDKVKGAASSVGRTIISNMLDTTKQEAFDMILFGNTFSGCIDSLKYGNLAEMAYRYLNSEYRYHPPVYLKELCEKVDDFTRQIPISVFVGTWNVNGGKHFRSIAFRHQSMADWLLHAQEIAARRYNREYSEQRKPDIYAIGFEELVDLNASNIFGTSDTNKNEWFAEIQRVLSKQGSYALVAVEQLVGVCLYIFVKCSLLPHIKDVAIDSVKTGLKGKTGNKGGIGIRFQVFSTSFCFICSHLAAGQQHVDDRNNDYKEIYKGLIFPLYSGVTSCDKSIAANIVDSHDYVFWCGDLNYRIDLAREEVIEMIKIGNWHPLQEEDQLIKSRENGLAFNGFREGKPNFAPTYKYDLFSDDYDTSEKQRTPAWTDRVMWKRVPNVSKRYKRFGIIRGENSEQSKSIDQQDHAQNQANMVHQDDPKVSHVNTGDSSSEDEMDANVVYRKYSKKISLRDSQLLEDVVIDNATDCQRKEGMLMYYDRTELKTSDHRPVAAIIDVTVDYLNNNEFEAYVKDKKAIDSQIYSPLSILISDMSDTTTSNLLPITYPLYRTLQRFGAILMIRPISSKCAIATYWNAKDAMRAAHVLDKTIINGREMLISLKVEFRRDLEDVAIDLKFDDIADPQDSTIRELNIPWTHIWLLTESQEQQLQITKKGPPVTTRPGSKQPPRPQRPPVSTNTSVSRPVVKVPSSPVMQRSGDTPRRPPRPGETQDQTNKRYVPERPTRSPLIDRKAPPRPPSSPALDRKMPIRPPRPTDGSRVASAPTLNPLDRNEFDSLPQPMLLPEKVNNQYQLDSQVEQQFSTGTNLFEKTEIDSADSAERLPPPIPPRRRDVISEPDESQQNSEIDAQFQVYDENSSSDEDCGAQYTFETVSDAEEGIQNVDLDSDRADDGVFASKEHQIHSIAVENIKPIPPIPAKRTDVAPQQKGWRPIPKPRPI